MDLKLDFRIALKYSLLIALLFLIHSIQVYATLDANYFPKPGTIYIITFIFPYVFGALVLKSFLEYIKIKKNYIDLAVISFLFLFLSYTLLFMIRFLFFKLFYEDVIIHREKGILGLLNGPQMLDRPEYHFVNDIILAPLSYLGDSVISGDLLRLYYTMFNHLFIVIIILYHFNLFFLFKKYEHNKWYSLVPILNKLTLIKIANRPLFWIVLVYVPFASYYFMYQINKDIAEDNGYDAKVALGMTFLPFVFYGKISFDEQQKLVQSASL